MEKNEVVLKYAVAALMISTAAIYFAVAVQESTELGQVEEKTENEIVGTGGQAAAVAAGNNDINGNNNAAGVAAVDANPSSVLAETVFFATVGTAYVGVAGWMLVDLSKAAKPRRIVDASRQNAPNGNIHQKTKVPYVIAIGGSSALIVLYLISRTVALPFVGLQEDVGTIDLVSKVLQAGIIGVGASLLLELRKSRMRGQLVR